ncbi:MAG TPA: PilZ domain-containing protein [Solirubrobacteraceae bacterium]|nr:PilZ domain-containing protein [Solirubrobacteraceae bacterium]
MRRLHEQQIVEIHLETDDPAITCRVASVTGAVATLMREGDAGESLPPAATGHLVFEHHGSLVALRGIAASLSEGEPKIEFVVIDNVVLPERRAAERIPLAAAVSLRPAGAQDDANATIETITADVSITGALIERRAGVGAQKLAMELRFTPDPAPISCHAQPVRETPTHVGLKFVDMPEADRARLAGIIFRYQRAALKPPGSQSLVAAHR